MTKYWALILVKDEEVVWEGWQLNKSYRFYGIDEPVSGDAEKWDGKGNDGTYYVVEVEDEEVM